MNKLIISIILLFVSMEASAATAYWTGRQQMIQTYNYQSVWNCEYRYAGQTFWRTFSLSCPSNIQL